MGSAQPLRDPHGVVPHRTLLALGCHVGMADEKAEENLKKIKLPKRWRVWGGPRLGVSVWGVHPGVSPL